MAFNRFDFTLLVWNDDKFKTLLHVDQYYVKEGALHVFFTKESKVPGPYIIPLHAFTLATPMED